MQRNYQFWFELFRHIAWFCLAVVLAGGIVAIGALLAGR